ncbi:MAG: hypothetical protein ACXV3U_05685 [Halobacteriota archaeon]
MTSVPGWTRRINATGHLSKAWRYGKRRGTAANDFLQARLIAEGGVNADEAIGNWFHPTY